MSAVIDHLVVTGASLDAASAYVEAALGVAMVPGGRHALMATHNRLLSLGPEVYLEALARDPERPPPGRARWFGLDDGRNDGRDDGRDDATPISAPTSAPTSPPGARPDAMPGVAPTSAPGATPDARHDARHDPAPDAATDAATAVAEIAVATPRLAGWALRVADLDAALARAPDGIGPAVAVERGDLRWRITVPDDGRQPFDGLFPALIAWEGETPAATLPETGARLVSLGLSHPSAGQLGWALSMLTGDDRVTVRTGPPGLRAVIHTEAGERKLA